MSMASPNPSWIIVSSHGSADTERVQHSPWLGPVFGANVSVDLLIPSFDRVLVNQETILVHLHITKVGVRTFNVSTTDQVGC